MKIIVQNRSPSTEMIKIRYFDKYLELKVI